LCVLFSYVAIKSDRLIKVRTSIREVAAYRFIKPLCEAWPTFDLITEMLPAPWGPTSSLHPRSIVREDKNREEINEADSKRLWAKSTKNHCKDNPLCVIVFVLFVTKNVSNLRDTAVPITVTNRGALFIALGTISVGTTNTNFVKNQPDTMVPIESRIRAPFRLTFSSLTGDIDGSLGEVRKQKTTIRNL